MVEVIYTFKQGRYPFGRGKQSVYTYMEYLLTANDEQEVNKYRQLNGMMKKLHHDNIMHLERILKQEMTFHMIYEFHNKSLEQRLKELTDEEQLVGLFVQLQNVFDCLIQKNLKAQLYLQYMGVDESNKLKVWIKPDELQFIGLTGTETKKIKKQLIEYYDTQRTRIHLEIQQIFENSQNNLSKKQPRTKQKQIKSSQQTNPNKPKTPNFVIEGNTLVFLNSSNKNRQDHILERNNEHHLMSKAHHLVYEQRPISKTQIPSTKTSSFSQQQPDISKMSVAQKVLYYKKLKQQQQNNDSNQLIIKDSSTSNASQHDLSKSSNNDSNLQIKTQMINKNKLKIITSQEVQVEGNSDDDLEKLARQKIAKINIEKQKGKTHDTSTQNYYNKSNTSGHSEKIEKYLKGLDQHSREENLERSDDHTRQINSKIAQAKLKAKNILEKYSQRLKK